MCCKQYKEFEEEEEEEEEKRSKQREQHLTLSCRSIYPMSSLKVFYHKLDYYNDVHISLEILVLNVFQPNLAEIWLMHYSVIKR